MCKYLLLNFFAKSTRFNEKLQRMSLSYMKYAVLFHMIIGGIMYSNNRIFSEQVRVGIEK